MWEDERGRQRGAQQRLAESSACQRSGNCRSPCFTGHLLGETVGFADSADEDKQKVKLVELPQTGTGDGCAGPSPVISLSHFLDEVSNQ